MHKITKAKARRQQNYRERDKPKRVCEHSQLQDRCLAHLRHGRAAAGSNTLSRVVIVNPAGADTCIRRVRGPFVSCVRARLRQKGLCYLRECEILETRREKDRERATTFLFLFSNSQEGLFSVSTGVLELEEEELLPSDDGLQHSVYRIRTSVADCGYTHVCAVLCEC